MADVTGIHHVTCMASRPEPNLRFYTGVLGMRLVKRSVNQDDPGTYHLFYADGAGTPGSDLTFFPWPHIAPGRRGVAETSETALAVPAGSLGFWAERLAEHGVSEVSRGTPFGEASLMFADPDGLPLTLTETADDQGFVPWEQGPVPVAHQVRRIHAVRVMVADSAPTVAMLTGALDLRAAGEDRGWLRFESPSSGSGTLIDVKASPDAPPARLGRGSVHHVAWRVPDDAAQARVRRRIMEHGLQPTPVIDRFWFRSVYFHEPGGVLFEIATDGPGFSVDEDTTRLGERLILPPWLEPRRADIEARLPPLEEALTGPDGHSA